MWTSTGSICLSSGDVTALGAKGPVVLVQTAGGGMMLQCGKEDIFISSSYKWNGELYFLHTYSHLLFPYIQSLLLPGEALKQSLVLPDGFTARCKLSNTNYRNR